MKKSARHIRKVHINALWRGERVQCERDIKREIERTSERELLSSVDLQREQLATTGTVFSCNERVYS